MRHNIILDEVRKIKSWAFQHFDRAVKWSNEMYITWRREEWRVTSHHHLWWENRYPFGRTMCTHDFCYFAARKGLAWLVATCRSHQHRKWASVSFVHLNSWIANGSTKMAPWRTKKGAQLRWSNQAKNKKKIKTLSYNEHRICTHI
jgi:hypothetical protein